VHAPSRFEQERETEIVELLSTVVARMAHRYSPRCNPRYCSVERVRSFLAHREYGQTQQLWADTAGA
jgi:ABC-type taurine transport system ATPase subunit